MDRLENWPARLNHEISEAARKPFAWGAHDCCQFAAQCVAALTGRDARSVFPAYETEAEANAIVESVGGLEALITRALGEPKPAAWAHRGDVVLCDFGKGPQPAVCIGVLCVAPGARGLETRPTIDAQKAWSV